MVNRTAILREIRKLLTGLYAESEEVAAICCSPSIKAEYALPDKIGGLGVVTDPTCESNVVFLMRDGRRVW